MLNIVFAGSIANFCPMVSPPAHIFHRMYIPIKFIFGGSQLFVITKIYK
jgi:hypothetical protein